MAEAAGIRQDHFWVMNQTVGLNVPGEPEAEALTTDVPPEAITAEEDLPHIEDSVEVTITKPSPPAPGWRRLGDLALPKMETTAKFLGVIGSVLPVHSFVRSKETGYYMVPTFPGAAPLTVVTDPSKVKFPEGTQAHDMATGQTVILKNGLWYGPNGQLMYPPDVL